MEFFPFGFHLCPAEKKASNLRQRSVFYPAKIDRKCNQILMKLALLCFKLPVSQMARGLKQTIAIKGLGPLRPP